VGRGEKSPSLKKTHPPKVGRREEETLPFRKKPHKGLSTGKRVRGIIKEKGVHRGRINVFIYSLFLPGGGESPSILLYMVITKSCFSIKRKKRHYSKKVKNTREAGNPSEGSWEEYKGTRSGHTTE